MARTGTSERAERRRQGSAAGFTLIELLVVLVVLALGAGAAVALIGRGTDTAAARGAAWDIAAALRTSRARAIRDNVETVFVLDVRNRTFKGSGAAGNLPEALTLTLVGAATERIDRDVGGIRFYADGSSTGGRITVASGEREYRVGVDWLTGQVTVAD